LLVLWRIPDDLWELIRVTLPAVELRPSGGRPWIAPRRIVDGVLFVLRTGCQWKAVPREFGSGSTVHRRFQRWTDEGRWEAMWRLLLQYAEATQQPEWVWQSADAALHKAPLGGKKRGRTPTDRAKSGTKRHVLTDGGGVPLAVVITAANVPDMRVVGELLDARVLRAPAGTEQHACLDKGYDYADAERVVRRRRYVPHIRRRGEERRRCRRGERARRWVVERTHSWFNRFRKLLIRCEKRPQNYLALVQFAAMLIVWRLVG